MNDVNNNNIANKAIVLKLNANWVAVEVAVVQDVFVALVSGALEAIDIEYEMTPDGIPVTTHYKSVRPVKWDEWMTLPVRPFDIAIHTTKMTIRVPTVVITHRYKKVPTKKFRGSPTKEGLLFRDNGLDIYTGKQLDPSNATKDHIIPLSRGGTDTYDNVGLTTKEINNQKGDRLNHEVGLVPKFKPTIPREVPAWKLIRKIRHPDWQFFLKHK
jgi:5-methylcytosine-specific restriction endonuclease McrA